MKHKRENQDSRRRKYFRSPLLLMIGCLLALILCVSCEKAMPPVTIEQREAEKDVIVQAVGESRSREKVINEAIAKCDEEKGSGSHQDYDISVSETTEEWLVYFDGKLKLPGNHAHVVINKRTGEITYMPGE